MEVDCGTGVGRGMTAIDPRGFCKKPANVYVGTQLNIDRVIELITQATKQPCALQEAH